MAVARAKKRKPRAVSAHAPVGLSHEKIVTAALRMIDRHGLDELSLRKIGAALRCEAMALYYYYPSKDALLDAVVDKLVAPIMIAAEGAGDWVEAMRAVARAYRRIAHEHPRAFPLLATRRFASEGTFAFLEQLFALGRKHGMSDRDTARFYRVISSYCNGFGLNELAGGREQAELGGATLRARFPHVEAVFAWLGPEHIDETFEFGLELVLSQLRTRKPR